MAYYVCAGCAPGRVGDGEHGCSGGSCQCAPCSDQGLWRADSEARELFVEVHARLGHGSGYAPRDWGTSPARDAAWRALAQILRERLRAPRQLRDAEIDARELFAETHRRLGDATTWQSSPYAPYTHDAWRMIARVFAEREVRAPIEDAQLDAEAEAIRREAGARCGSPLAPGAKPGPIWRAVARIVNERVRAGCAQTSDRPEQARRLGALALAADEFVRFVAGLPTQDLPLRDQRELRERVSAMRRKLRGE